MRFAVIAATVAMLAAGPALAQNRVQIASVRRGANFGGAEMGRARGLTQAQLNGACGDETTELPRGLRLRGC